MGFLIYIAARGFARVDNKILAAKVSFVKM